MRIIQVGGLVDELEDFSEQNLMEVISINKMFQVYGKVEFIDLHKEKNGKNKGFAFIQYANAKDARLAIDKMNGFIFKSGSRSEREQ
jgi:RNA recognition motif-containing protein